MAQKKTLKTIRTIDIILLLLFFIEVVGLIFFKGRNSDMQKMIYSEITENDRITKSTDEELIVIKNRQEYIVSKGKDMINLQNQLEDKIQQLKDLQNSNSLDTKKLVGLMQEIESLRKQIDEKKAKLARSIDTVDLAASNREIRKLKAANRIDSAAIADLLGQNFDFPQFEAYFGGANGERVYIAKRVARLVISYTICGCIHKPELINIEVSDNNGMIIKNALTNSSIFKSTISSFHDSIINIPMSIPKPGEYFVKVNSSSGRGPSRIYRVTI